MNNSQEDHQMLPQRDPDSFPPVSRPDQAEAIGTQMGPYKLLSFLGEGGFGIVYLAEQKKPVRRQVALKVIKPGMDSKQVIARFETEQQALALLDHPNIAHVFDAGTTEKGRLYFAMEYVKGRSVIEYCDQEKLSIEERLELFMRICQAVQHAHQKGIIHRDIKPSNILVSVQSGQPIPKIIDFGVAKALSQPLTERTLFTEQGQLIGTPEYMSPEQAEIVAQNVDTRSDVYSLGVVLYELLSGSLPFDPKTLRQAAFGEIQRIIREEEPPRPSTRISTLGDSAMQVAQKRRMDVKRLVKRLHNELEWIPLMAMRKEPSRRYKTASELADDIRNYLNGDPLIAGPESTMYRLRKIVERHQALMGSIAAVLLVLIAGIVVSTKFALGEARERRRAENAQDLADEESKKRKEEAKIAEGVIKFLQNDLIASAVPAPAGGRGLTVREFLVAAPEKIKDQVKDGLLVEERIRRVLGCALMSLGEFEKAESLCDKALEIRKQLGKEDPDILYNLAAEYFKYGHYEKAELLYLKILEMQKKDDLITTHPITLNSMYNLALLYTQQGRNEEADSLSLKILETIKHMLGEEHPHTLTTIDNIAGLYKQQDRYDEAERLYLQALEGRRRVLGEKHPRTLESLNNLIDLYEAWNKPEKAEEWRAELQETKAVGK